MAWNLNIDGDTEVLVCNKDGNNWMVPVKSAIHFHHRLPDFYGYTAKRDDAIKALRVWVKLQEGYEIMKYRDFTSKYKQTLPKH